MLASVRRLGVVSYSAGLSLQESLAAKYKDAGRDQVGEVLLCEHPPVFTFGLREREWQEKEPALRRTGAEVLKIRRGGLTTFHGPGQLVCYPVLNLRQLKIGVREYVRCLEESVINTCAEFAVAAHRTEHTGVWVCDSKICAIGIQVRHGVAFHGLALNCNTELSWFDNITPCGVEGKTVTSLTQLTGKTVTPDEAAPHLVRALARVVGFRVREPENWPDIQ